MQVLVCLLHARHSCLGFLSTALQEQCTGGSTAHGELRSAVPNAPHGRMQGCASKHTSCCFGNITTPVQPARTPVGACSSGKQSCRRCRCGRSETSTPPSFLPYAQPSCTEQRPTARCSCHACSACLSPPVTSPLDAAMPQPAAPCHPIAVTATSQVYQRQGHAQLAGTGPQQQHGSHPAGHAAWRAAAHHVALQTIS